MSWSKRLPDPSDGDFQHWQNPFNFYRLLAELDDKTLLRWLRRKKLVASSMHCAICTRPCKEVKSASKRGGIIWRCRGSITWPHSASYSAFHHSIFEGSHFDVREILVFLREWVLGSSLHRCAISSGMDYKRTAVDWGNFMRDICKQFVHELYYNDPVEQLKGEIEIDESLFGRRCKFNRGDPRGVKVWIFGMVERSTNRLILYPVDERTERLLIPIIERHVAKGSTIYSDGWRAYHSLNQRGYSHFTVEHKYRFKQQYRDMSTGKLKDVHTNTIEGAWKHAKDHFRCMNGTRVANFEGHLCEILWRNRATVQKANRLQFFVDLVRKYFSLARKVSFTANDPLFHSWTANQEDDRVIRHDVHEFEQVGPPEEPTPLDPADIPSTSRVHDSPPPANSANPSNPDPKRQMSPSKSASESAKKKPKKGRKKTTKVGKKTAAKHSSHRTSTGTLCHPSGFFPVDKEGNPITTKTTSQRQAGKYGKADFIYELSSDSDFQ